MGGLPEFVEKVFGGPGTGKTTHLMGRLKEEVLIGTQPWDIGFIAFSRAAIAQATQEALRVVNENSRGADRLPYFLTFHSLAARLLQTTDDQYVKPKHKTFWAKHVGLEYDPLADDPSAAKPEASESSGLPFANRLFQVDEWLTNNLLDVSHCWKAPYDVGALEYDVERLLQKWRTWKAASRILNHADLVELACHQNLTAPVSALFVDEFQDLSPLQYAWYERLSTDPAVQRVYIAGDDDQTIYGFQGANARFLLDARSSHEVILEKTHRFGTAIIQYAGDIIRRVARRKDKRPQSTNEGGEVVVLERPNADELIRHIDPADTFILTRTNMLADKVGKLLIQHGIPFHNSEHPDKGGATWSTRLIAAKHAYETLYKASGSTVPYEVALDFLKLLPSYHKTDGKGFVRHGAKAEFERLPLKFPGLVTPLGQDLSRWSLTTLRPYFARVPDKRELLDAWNLDGQQRDALLNHLRLRPSWPIRMPDPLGREPCGVHVRTIHSSKGLQARTVVLCGDFSRRMLNTYHNNEDEHDAETRVFYVGATRARHRLVVVRPFLSGHTFPLPDAPTRAVAA